MANRGDYWRCKRCGTEIEARSRSQAKETHDLVEDHEFENDNAYNSD